MTVTDSDNPKTDVDMTYLEKKNIDDVIHQKLRNKNVYETNIHKIYNFIVGQTKEQLQEKAESDTAFLSVNTCQ